MNPFKEDMTALKSAVYPLRNIADELRIALEGSDQFTVRYQPIIDPKSKHVELVEALLRWTSPVLGEVLPGRFIHVAERKGLIREVTRMVLKKVCQDLSQYEGLVASVNVSRSDITDPAFAEEVCEIVSAARINPTQVILECTDEITKDEVSKAAKSLQRLRQEGHAVAIYEMESGFTSFGFLEMQGFTLLKIDKVLIEEALQSEISRENLQDALDTARAKGFKSLAFGVETAAEARLADEMGFDFQQGFYHSKPLSIDELLKYSGHTSKERKLADV